MTNEDWMEFMKQSIASHDRQLGELTDKMAQAKAESDAKISDLAVHMINLADHMAALAQTCIHHERRLNNIDGL